jgi:hypothetical protein
MRARQLFRFRAKQKGVTVEMVVWALPQKSAERQHGLKYRLYCGRGGVCLVRYDNEAGKGNHRHYGEREEVYGFESLDKLLEDFRNDCTRLAGWSWR